MTIDRYCAIVRLTEWRIKMSGNLNELKTEKNGTDNWTDDEVRAYLLQYYTPDECEEMLEFRKERMLANKRLKKMSDELKQYMSERNAINAK